MFFIDYKVDYVRIMLPKTSAYVKLNGESKTIIWRKNILVFGLKSVIVLKKDLIVNPSEMQHFENQNKVLR